MKSTFRLGRIFGIDIGAHASWLIIVVLVTLSLATQFRREHPDWSVERHWAGALLTALLFFASVVIHELAHSLTARRYGIGVRSITLFLFGGVSQIESESRRPREEFVIAVVGPLTSFGLAILFQAGSLAAGAASFAGALAGWLAAVNLMLGAFNLLPAFPLDGGRVLRAVVWWWTGDVRRATRAAALGGRVLASLMMLAGVLLFFSGGGIGGLWFVFLGWFLLDAARSGAAQAELKHALAGVTAGDLMSDCPTVEGNLALDRFVDEQLLRAGRRCYLVVEDGVVRGLITARDLQRVPRERWASTSVVEASRTLQELRTVDRATTAEKVLERMAKDDVNQLPVIEDGRLLGVVSRDHIIRLLTTRSELGT